LGTRRYRAYSFGKLGISSNSHHTSAAINVIVLLPFSAYLVGAIPFGVIVSRVFAYQDVRKLGSGNIGATNVARTAGKKLGFLVLALDTFKGALPTYAAMRWFPQLPWIQAATGGAAIIGHVFPIYLGFSGGKGVATSLGVFAMLTPWATTVGLGAFFLGVATFRTVAFGSLLGTISASFYALYTSGLNPHSGLLASAMILIVMRHRRNLVGLCRSTF
jgi:glycerol-3-phosphate acyltransferase PlsY